MDVVDGSGPQSPVYAAGRRARWRGLLARAPWALVVLLALVATEIGLLRLLRAVDPWAGATRTTLGRTDPELADRLGTDLVAGLLDEVGARQVAIDEGPSWLLGRPSRLDASLQLDGESLDATFAVSAEHPGVGERLGDGRARLERVDGHDVLVTRFAGVRRSQDLAVVHCQGVTVRVTDPVSDAAAPAESPSLAARTAADLVDGVCPPLPPLPADAGLLRLVLASDVGSLSRDRLVGELAGVDGVLAVHPVRWEDAARPAAAREPPGRDAERLQDSVLVRVEARARDELLAAFATDGEVVTIEDEGPTPALVKVLPRPGADLALLEAELRADPDVSLVTLRTEERARARFTGTPTAGNPDARTALLVWLRTGGEPARTALADRVRARPDVEGTA